MIAKLEELYEKFQKEICEISDKNALGPLRSQFLGKKGAVSDILRGLKNASMEEKRSLGSRSNEIKMKMESDIKKKAREIDRAEVEEQLKKEWMDVSDRKSVRELGLTGGGFHPVRMIQKEIEDIFLSMGMTVLDGPHIEDDYHNFEALNIPAHHPARDMQDTFWFEGGVHLLRTHTSTIQVRGMENHKPPFKFVGPGKVFRCERTDASHDMVFHQVEGMVVDKGINVSHLIHFMKILLREIFRQDVKVRLRPGYFPFVEPGFELDINCLLCKGKGCKACKYVGWLELLPCGLVHPKVLEYGKISPKNYSGLAFGLGLDRLVMMRYGIEDIRHLHAGDLRFLAQFQAFA